jgi:hypothetical protein
VEFIDKAHSGYVLERPGDFLSERALLRRAKQQIAVTQADLPVSEYYTDSLARMHIKILHVSRWFNSALIRGTEADIEQLQAIGFIKKTAFIPKEKEQMPDTSKWGIDLSTLFRKRDTRSLYGASPAYYGQAANQVGMLHGHLLHERGYRGTGLLIAVIDEGFNRVEYLSGFEKIRKKGALPQKNFTEKDERDYESLDHGTNVLSIIAADLPGQIVGSAPDADYVLLQSEEAGSEYLAEEDNWIAAVEYADSIGVDLITCSLGYSVFDDTAQNHVHADLDGHTIRASRAAAMAAARGIIVCVSAGNDGNRSWKYISIPADADSVLTVGAVDVQKKYAAFSSTGPTADGRIKPDLVVMGDGAVYQSQMGQINTGDGTSYATPLLAGFMACLWQAFPDKNAMEIIRMVRQSADRHLQPDPLYGYGIPDFGKLLPAKHLTSCSGAYHLGVFPNHPDGGITVHLSPARHGKVHIRLRTLTGHAVYAHTDYLPEYDAYECVIAGDFAPGTYFVEAQTDAGKSASFLISDF